MQPESITTGDKYSNVTSEDKYSNLIALADDPYSCHWRPSGVSPKHSATGSTPNEPSKFLCGYSVPFGNICAGQPNQHALCSAENSLTPFSQGVVYGLNRAAALIAAEVGESPGAAFPLHLNAKEAYLIIQAIVYDIREEAKSFGLE